MCEIMTICAATIFSALYFVQKKNGKNYRNAEFASLMFWGASLMWLCDCIFSAAGGEPFFDISAKDTLLGAIIIAAGLAIFTLRELHSKFTKK